MRDERGAGTVLGLAMAGVVLFVTIATTGVVAVVGGHRAAQTAADLAALAGATAVQQGGSACAQAAAIAGRNHARLTGCRVTGWSVLVTVQTPIRVWGLDYALPARSTAGPAAGT